MYCRLILILSLILSVSSNADDFKERFYVKAYGGLNFQSGKSLEQEGVANPGATGKLKLDSAFRSGMSFGYKFKPKWSVEFAYDYITNSSNARFSDGTFFQEGDYSSVILFTNMFYHLKTYNKFTPYFGGGLGYIQEIDIDLETSGVESSFSTRGGMALQISAGAEYKINKQFFVFTDLTYVSASGIDLKAQQGPNRINNVDYTPVSIMFGLKYAF